MQVPLVFPMIAHRALGATYGSREFAAELALGIATLSSLIQTVMCRVILLPIQGDLVRLQPHRPVLGPWFRLIP